MPTPSTQADTAKHPLPSGLDENTKPIKALREKVANAMVSVITTVAPPPATPAFGKRPTETTPYGTIYTDTPQYAHYRSLVEMRDFAVNLRLRMERMEATAPQFVTEIDDFIAGLDAQYRGPLVETLGYIKRALNGDTEVKLGGLLNGLRAHGDHYTSAASAAGNDCERAPSPYTVPATPTDLPPWEQRRKVQLVNGRRPSEVK